jgi:hypothetical protein
VAVALARHPSEDGLLVYVTDFNGYSFKVTFYNPTDALTWNYYTVNSLFGADSEFYATNYDVRDLTTGEKTSLAYTDWFAQAVEAQAIRVLNFTMSSSSQINTNYVKVANWSPASKGGHKSSEAAGYTNAYEGIFACRVKMGANIAVGGLVPSSERCFVNVNGQESSFTDYQVLELTNAAETAWVVVANGQLPSGVIQAGRVGDAPIFVGRVAYADYLLVGGVNGQNGELNVPFFDQKLTFTTGYEVLTIKSIRFD